VIKYNGREIMATTVSGSRDRTYLLGRTFQY
jgi:hypothetical protein